MGSPGPGIAAVNIVAIPLGLILTLLAYADQGDWSAGVMIPVFVPLVLVLVACIVLAVRGWRKLKQ